MASSNHLSSSQLAEIREAFDIFDSDKSGTISSSEMKAVFNALSIKASDAEITAVIRQMDVDGDGEISFDEFVRVMAPSFYRKSTMKEIETAFRHFDKDNDGFISVDELKLVLNRMGRNASKEEVTRMVKHIDKNGDGKISLDEFAELLLK